MSESKGSNKKTYWRSPDELNQDEEFLKQQAEEEFPQYLSIKDKTNMPDAEGMTSDRRDFLKLMGFGVAAASLAACEAPVKKAIPYVNKPEEVEPGVANYYASSFMNGSEYCSVVVKTREGRPIKIDGNTLSSVTMGGTNARTQASVLELYDEDRLRNFVVKGEEREVFSGNEEYAALDNEIISELKKADKRGGVYIVSSSINSPSTLRAIERFRENYPNTEHIMYDPVSVDGILEANQESFGKRAVPAYDFSKAQTIVSFNADFLGTWISPIQYARQYSVTRKVDKEKREMSRHYQFESNMTLTGANADHRYQIKPSEEGLFVAALYQEITGESLNIPSPSEGQAFKRSWSAIKQVASDLKASNGNSIVVSGSNDKNVQLLINKINSALENYGNTMSMSPACNLKQGNNNDMVDFINKLDNKQVGGVIFYDCNPVYDHPLGNKLANGLSKTSVSISFSRKLDETSRADKIDYICPDLHYLESWNDAEPYENFYSLQQPTIRPLFKGTRSAQESLLIWAEADTLNFYDFVKSNWESNILGNQSWDIAVRDGVYEPDAVTEPEDRDFDVDSVTTRQPDSYAATGSSDAANKSRTARMHKGYRPSLLESVSTSATSAGGDAGAAVESIKSQLNNFKGKSLEITLYEKVGLGDGSHNENPWLQEMPDPVTKATWGNYLTIPMKYAADNELKQGDIVKITVGGQEINVPVFIQPGQAPQTVGLAVGYGRSVSGKDGFKVGVNAYPLIRNENNSLSYIAPVDSITSTGDFQAVATTQTQHTVMGRESVIQESNLNEYQDKDWKRKFTPHVSTWDGEALPGEEGTDLWYHHDKPNHLWGMVIDLNSCIGCGACTVSCQVENNVPVVGKQEVINRREMHWLRIDRYYSTAAEDGDYEEMEKAEMNPEVVFQPMLCQHCNHAPCETVCPVAATTNSSEGLNQMVYNRCIGTRYCANNCPYKVRRFNWFKYHDNDMFDVNTSMHNMLGKMVLNPDVTVRSRGVMEKCTFCVQRIQEGKLTAKKEKRRPVDGEIVTACAEACPTDAITFGDLNDGESLVHNQMSDTNNERAYSVLTEINTRPNIAYLTKIRNKKA